MRVTGVRSDVTAKWENRYREVLDVAAIAFAENGYLGASTRDIAERLGIRAASLYYYLPSKEAALLAICKLSVLDFIDNLRDIIARRDPAPENPGSTQKEIRAKVAPAPYKTDNRKLDIHNLPPPKRDVQFLLSRSANRRSAKNNGGNT